MSIFTVYFYNIKMSAKPGTKILCAVADPVITKSPLFNMWERVFKSLASQVRAVKGLPSTLAPVDEATSTSSTNRAYS